MLIMEVFIFKFFITNIVSACPILIGEVSTLNHKFLDLMKRASFQFHHFPGGSDGKVSAYSLGDPGSTPGLEDSLEKEMATHSSTLAWKIPWMEEPGGLQSMGLQRVGHD